MAGNNKLRELLERFTTEVEQDPRMFGRATLEFIQEANEAIGTRPKPPLVGWIVPRGTSFQAQASVYDWLPRIAGIELNDDLRKGIILNKHEILSCADGMHQDATNALTTLIAKAKTRMDKIT